MADEENKYGYIRKVGLLTTIPAVLLAGPVIGYYIGDYLDKKFGTSPWLMMILMGLGFAASVRQTILLIKSAGENSNK